MPALPWVSRQPINPETEYLAMASCLPLRRYRSIPGFLRDTLAIRHQLATTTGLVGYALNAELTQKTFWTFSLWDDRDHLEVFAGDSPHRQIIGRLGPLMDQTRFEFFPVAGREFPWTWTQMKAPLLGRYTHGRARHLPLPPAETLTGADLAQRGRGDDMSDMARTGPDVEAQPLIAVRDVRASSKWYAELLDADSLPEHPHRDVYERISRDGRLLLQLHAWDEEDHPNLVRPDLAPPGHGVVLWFQVVDFDAAVERAESLGAEIIEGPLTNAAPMHREVWLRDPNHYVVVVASPDGEAADRARGS